MKIWLKGLSGLWLWHFYSDFFAKTQFTKMMNFLINNLKHPYHFLQRKTFSPNYNKKKTKIDSTTSRTMSSEMKDLESIQRVLVWVFFLFPAVLGNIVSAKKRKKETFSEHKNCWIKEANLATCLLRNHKYTSLFKTSWHIIEDFYEFSDFN